MFSTTKIEKDYEISLSRVTGDKRHEKN